LNKQIISATLGALASVLMLATPGYSSTFLAFSTSPGTAGGTAVVTGNTSAETLTSVTGIDYTTLTISGDTTNPADNGTWTLTSTSGSGKATMSLSGSTFTLTGEIGSCTSGCGAGTPNLTGISGALETFTVSSKAYNTSASTSSNAVAGFFTSPLPAQNSFTLAFGTPTSMTTLASLTNALSFSGVSSNETSGGISSNTTATGSGPYTFTATSETLNVTLTSTPEPVSFLLVGGGLIGLAFFGRRRSARS
jgi:hypothetical protein